MPARPRTLFAQLLSYAFVGLLSNLAGYLVYLLITWLGAGPKVTMTLLYATGACIGFWGNRRITFRHDEKGMAVGVRYLLAHCVGYTINFVLLYVLVDRMGYAHQIAQAFAIFVVAGFLFVAFKYFVFPVPATAAQAPR
ncbi:GtrA-like protein [Variovorax sp. OK605]|uniref:GtrA family protein n=1 Tax=Variovorax sp. OK605 TaxID=1855317 RepID=UPI0008EF17AD|nr:GtrA family protein [Variovorax sp. OK605]SFQ49348.1 GtrA-like protein [Variovorax sp. OK605]